jgi:hypothetical protein
MLVTPLRFLLTADPTGYHAASSIPWVGATQVRQQQGFRATSLYTPLSRFALYPALSDGIGFLQNCGQRCGSEPNVNRSASSQQSMGCLMKPCGVS